MALTRVMSQPAKWKTLAICTYVVLEEVVRPTFPITGPGRVFLVAGSRSFFYHMCSVFGFIAVITNSENIGVRWCGLEVSRRRGGLFVNRLVYGFE